MTLETTILSRLYLLVTRYKGIQVHKNLVHYLTVDSIIKLPHVLQF